MTLFQHDRHVAGVQSEGEFPFEDRKQSISGQFLSPALQERMVFQFPGSELHEKMTEIIAGGDNGRGDIGLFRLDAEDGAEDFQDRLRILGDLRPRSVGQLDRIGLGAGDPLGHCFENVVAEPRDLPRMQPALPLQLLQILGSAFGDREEQVLPEDSTWR